MSKDYEDEVDPSLGQAMITKEDIIFLMDNTDFDECDIREWFKEFLKVKLRLPNKRTNYSIYYTVHIYATI